MSPSFDGLRQIMPLAPSAWLTALVAMDAGRWNITNEYRWAAFIGQLAHESAQFTALEENLSYRKERLMAVWPRRFPDEQSTVGFVLNPEALANKVYANRMGNGPETSGDGWRFRGRGPIQLTGRDNYSFASAAVDVDLLAMPQRMLDPDIGVAVSGWYWSSKGANQLADVEDHREITRRINGGTIGLDDRLAWVEKARAALLAARTGV